LASSQLATSLSVLAPAQRAGAQRLCALAHRVGSLRRRNMSEVEGKAEVPGARSRRRD